MDDSVSTRIKIVERSQFLDKSLTVLKNNPDFVLLVLKLVTLILNVPVPKVVSLIDQKLSTYVVETLFLSEDTQILIYSINLIYKIIRSTSGKIKDFKKVEHESRTLTEVGRSTKENSYGKKAPTTPASSNLTPSLNSDSKRPEQIQRSNWSLNRIHNLLEKLLSINPDNMDKPEAILAVKYKTFNDLVGRLPKKNWPEYAFIWIIFTCDILLIGLVRDYRNAQFEEWLVN